MIGQFFDTMILASTDKECLIYNDPSNSKSWKVLETVSSHLKHSARRHIFNSRQSLIYYIKEHRPAMRAKGYNISLISLLYFI